MLHNFARIDINLEREKTHGVKRYGYTFKENRRRECLGIVNDFLLCRQIETKITTV